MTTRTLQPAASSAVAADRPAIIAHRGACEADGVGLSHYILLDPAAPTRPLAEPAANRAPAA